MTNSPISAVLPASPPSTGLRRGSEGSETPAQGSSFSNILARQHSSDHGKPSSGAIDQAGGKDGKAAQKTKDKEDASAEATSEQALSLPQLALRIAAEVAAVKRPAVTLDGQPAAGKQAQMSQDVGETIAARNSADTLARSSKIAKALVNSATAERKPGTDVAANRALSPGFVPVMPAATPETAPRPTALALEVPGSTPGTAVAPARAASIAGAKQAVLAMQARAQAAGAARDGAPLPEFLTLANGAAVAGSTGAQAEARLASITADTPLGPFGTLAATPVATDMHNASGLDKPGTLTGNATGQVGLSISTPLGSPQWGSDFGRQFVSLAQAGANMPQTAELRLDPPELGPLRISINVVDNVAHAVFVSAHANVRQTLENSLPQLQQLLAQAGISLGQTSVSDHGQPQQAFGDGQGDSPRQTTQAVATGGGSGGDVPHASPRGASRIPAADALVDTFA